jgi:S-adenosylmethionine decarboxylase
MTSTHILLDIQCKPGAWGKEAEVAELLNNAVNHASLKKVNETYHQFSPAGVTGVVLLSESHVCVHTWPEQGKLAVDIFACGDPEKAERCSDMLIQSLAPHTYVKKVFKRV